MQVSTRSHNGKGVLLRFVEVMHHAGVDKIT